MKYLIKLKNMIKEVESVGRFLWFNQRDQQDQIENEQDKRDRETEHDD